MSDSIDIAPVKPGAILYQIADRFLNRPLLLHPTKAEVIWHVLHGRLPVDGALAGPLPADANRFLGRNSREDGSYRMVRVQNGVGILPIVGSLVNRGAWIGTSSGLVSYEGIGAMLRDAEADPEIHSVLLDIDSPGGEATGMFSVAEQIRQLSAKKPVTAFVNDMAASAAYGLASAAGEIVVSPTSMVGSIGVVLTHLDRSTEMAQRGLKATLIYAGAHKVDGNPYGPLPAAVHADLQAEVSKIYDQFVGLVARGRHALSLADIRATEARTFIGQDAIARGLADRMASLDEVLAALSAEAPVAVTPRTTDMAMNTSSPPTALPAPDLEPHTAALDAARAEGAALERARITRILRHEVATGREAQAIALALDTDIAAEAALKVLAATPIVTTRAAATIAERAAAEAELGASAHAPTAAAQAAERVARGWQSAVANANQRFG